MKRDRGRKDKATPKQEKRGTWQPLRRGAARADYDALGLTPPDAVFYNDLYSVFVRFMNADHESGPVHLSFHRKDRRAIRDWRHFQAIKNECVGSDRLAVEVFPPESSLVDTANEYHLWVLPREMQRDFPFLLDGGDVRLVLTNEEANEIAPGAVQRDWEPGIPTGLGAES